MASSSTSALTSASLQDENQLLQQELNKVEDLLSTARAERDEIIIRYNALNDRLENNMKTNANAVTSGANGSGESEFDENAHHHENRILTQQIIELRRRLDDDHSSYKRKLQHYQESQQKQAQLVSKLQQKVLQYKTKCNELELSLAKIVKWKD